MTNQNSEEPGETVGKGKTIKPFTRADIKKIPIQILEFVGTDGLASLENLHRKFWVGGSLKDCRRFLSYFEKEEWLKRHYIHVCKPGQLVFTLTAKGARENFSQ